MKSLIGMFIHVCNCVHDSTYQTTCSFNVISFVVQYFLPIVCFYRFGPSIEIMRESVKAATTSEFCSQSDVFFLVALLRAMGLRTRLVLVLEVR